MEAIIITTAGNYLLFLSDLYTGINTKAPDINIVTITGPSILSAVVKTM